MSATPRAWGCWQAAASSSAPSLRRCKSPNTGRMPPRLPGLAGLSREQRSGALRSLSGGDIPTDPAVLLAAMEIAAVAAAGRIPGRGLWVLRMVILALWAVSVIYLIGNGDVAQGVVWAGLGSVLAGDWAWD